MSLGQVMRIMESEALCEWDAKLKREKVGLLDLAA